MQWIGVTGNVGAGKSSVGEIIVESGYPLIQADQLAHQTLDPTGAAYASVVQLFGPGILDDQRRIDRKKLAEKVFGDRTLLKKLEAIIHPLVRNRSQELRKELEQAQHRFAFYEVALLFEKNLIADFDAIILIVIDQDLVLTRLQNGRGWSVDEISRRMSQQIPQEQKLARADYVIRNNGSRAELRNQVRAILHKMESQ